VSWEFLARPPAVERSVAVEAVTLNRPGTTRTEKRPSRSVVRVKLPTDEVNVMSHGSPEASRRGYGLDRTRHGVGVIPEVDRPTLPSAELSTNIFTKSGRPTARAVASPDRMPTRVTVIQAPEPVSVRRPHARPVCPGPRGRLTSTSDTGLPCSSSVAGQRSGAERDHPRTPRVLKSAQYGPKSTLSFAHRNRTMTIAPADGSVEGRVRQEGGIERHPASSRRRQTFRTGAGRSHDRRAGDSLSEDRPRMRTVP
jgi:hypothetical protein